MGSEMCIRDRSQLRSHFGHHLVRWRWYRILALPKDPTEGRQLRKSRWFQPANLLRRQLLWLLLLALLLELFLVGVVVHGKLDGRATCCLVCDFDRCASTLATFGGPSFTVDTLEYRYKQAVPHHRKRAHSPPIEHLTLSDHTRIRYIRHMSSIRSRTDNRHIIHSSSGAHAARKPETYGELHTSHVVLAIVQHRTIGRAGVSRLERPSIHASRIMSARSDALRLRRLPLRGRGASGVAPRSALASVRASKPRDSASCDREQLRGIAPCRPPVGTRGGRCRRSAAARASARSNRRNAAGRCQRASSRLNSDGRSTANAPHAAAAKAVSYTHLTLPTICSV